MYVYICMKEIFYLIQNVLFYVYNYKKKIVTIHITCFVAEMKHNYVDLKKKRTYFSKSISVYFCQK